MRGRTWGGAAALSLPLLLAILPFEPRQPTLPLLGLQFTLLECAAGAVMAVLFSSCRERLGELVRRPPLPLAFLATYAGANLLSAAVAPAHRGPAAVFCLRMVAAAVFALLVAAAPPEARRRGFAALVGGSTLVALLAIAEGCGVRSLDPFLDAFRLGPSEVAGSRRATGGLNDPNLAATFLMHGMLVGVGMAADLPGPLRMAIPYGLLVGLGLLFTDSRGGFLAALFGLATLGVALGRGGRARIRAPMAALLTLLALAPAFALRPTFQRLSIEGAASEYGARYEPAEASLSLKPREARSIRVRVTNTGREAWDPAGGFQIHTLWYDMERKQLMGVGQAFSPRIPRRAVPGDIVDLEVEVRAPEREGPYLLVWDLLGREVGWFLSFGVVPAQVPTAVSASGAGVPPLGFELPAATWRRGRLELWRLALVMWRAHPFTGVGPDNFRWLHDAYGGWVRPDPESPAHSLFLEAAATTGALGLLALLGTFLSTARAALRSLRMAAGSADAVPAAVILALLAGIAAHGVVDYFLSFTGHYLFLGFVVGSASVLGRSEDPTRSLDP